MTNSGRRLPPPTFERIERAWRGRPIEAPHAPEGPPPPPPSTFARRLNWSLAALMVGLYLFAGVGMFLAWSPKTFILAAGFGNLTAVTIGLRTRRILRVMSRGQIIARREREPFSYWSSLCLIGLFGFFFLWLGWTTAAS